MWANCGTESPAQWRCNQPEHTPSQYIAPLPLCEADWSIITLLQILHLVPCLRSIPLGLSVSVTCYTFPQAWSPGEVSVSSLFCT